MRLLFTFLLFICFSFSAKSQLLYEVTFPDDQVVYGCGASADTIWPVITKYGNCAFNVGVSVYDQVFYTNDSQGCYKILRRWRDALLVLLRSLLAAMGDHESSRD